jgi:hypothetical protein
LGLTLRDGLLILLHVVHLPGRGSVQM